MQVASVKQANLGQYSSLNSYGEVYTAEAGGFQKIRVGIFSTREEAVAALQTIKRSGYRDAFLVKEEGALLGSAPATPPQQPTYPVPGTTTTPRGGLYKIQLAAYRNPQFFDPTPVANLGTIEERMKGNLTVKFVGGIQTLTQARQALAQARAAGFNTSFIVIEENGQLRKVN